MARKDFRKLNDGFLCKRCGAQNMPASSSMRNHCRACLFSLHVDEEMPGDRRSACFGLMEPGSLDYRGNKGFMILHRCVECGKEIWNRAAEDDELERISHGASVYPIYRRGNKSNE